MERPSPKLYMLDHSTPRSVHPMVNELQCSIRPQDRDEAARETRLDSISTGQHNNSGRAKDVPQTPAIPPTLGDRVAGILEMGNPNIISQDIPT